MSRVLHGLAFAAIAFGILFGVHRYVWARLVRDPSLPRAWRRGLTIALVVLGVSLPVEFVVGLRSRAAGELARVVWSWSGFVFYAVLLAGLFDLARFALRRATRSAREPVPPQADAPADPGRRVLLARSLAGAAAIGAGGTVFAGRRAAEEITTPEIEVELARLPRALAGYRIVQLSDVHIGSLLGERFLARVVDVANAQRPDLVVITGDLVDGSVASLARELAPLSRLRARHGVAFVTGNHEYYSGVVEWGEWLEQNGLRVLTNERVSIGDAGASFDLAGVPDRQGGLFLPEHEPDLGRALLGRDPERELVVLAHRPAQIEMSAAHDAGLQLSGHTHGGQLWPFGALVRLAEPYVSGLHRHGPRTQVYVSRGTGFWGPPMRIGNPAEVTRIVLR